MLIYVFFCNKKEFILFARNMNELLQILGVIMDGFEQRQSSIKVGLSSAEMVYYQAGCGYPLLLLHGWGVDAASFAPVAEYLRMGFAVYAVDFPGFGASLAPAEIWGVTQYADLIEGFCKELKLDKPLIIGHSFGGRVAIMLGARGLPLKMVLVDSAGILPKRGLDYYFRVYSYKAGKKILSLPGLGKLKKIFIQKNNVGSADYKAAQGIIKKIFVKVVNQDLKEFLPKISASVLLVWGDADTATPLADGQLMEKLIPDAGLVVFSGAGHYSYLERLPQFLAVLDSFFAKEKKNEENG